MDVGLSPPPIAPPRPTERPPKRLLFDRRYGWVVDEWKDPSEQALVGGRGMFCILPIAKSLLKIASQSINAATVFAIRAHENPHQFSPEAFRATLNRFSQKLMQFLQKPNLKLLAFRGDSPPPAV